MFPAAHAVLRCGAVAVALSGLSWTAWAAAELPAARALQDQHGRLGGQLQRNAFGRPLVLQSSERDNTLRGDIYAVVDYPIELVNVALHQPAQWCEVMILHINTKYCRAVALQQGTVVRVYIGKKTPQLLADATRVEFDYGQMAATATYFAVALSAREGPLGTHDYRIQLEAVALPAKQTFLHLSYSYGVGLAGRLAMQTYLATVAADKVGFTQVGRTASGQVQLMGGLRGVVERNAMRYFLAIDSYLAAAGVTPSAQLEQRLQAWFTAVERYPRQLHEIDRSAYLEMKRAEHARQQAVL